MEEHINKIQQIITDLWKKEFPDVDEKNRFLIETEENKNKVIDFFVKRILFCDKLDPPKKDFNSIKNLNQTDIIKTKMVNKIRIRLYEDCKNSKYIKEIQETLKNYS